MKTSTVLVVGGVAHGMGVGTLPLFALCVATSSCMLAVVTIPTRRSRSEGHIPLAVTLGLAIPSGLGMLYAAGLGASLAMSSGASPEVRALVAIVGLALPISSAYGVDLKRRRATETTNAPRSSAVASR